MHDLVWHRARAPHVAERCGIVHEHRTGAARAAGTAQMRAQAGLPAVRRSPRPPQPRDDALAGLAAGGQLSHHLFKPSTPSTFSNLGPLPPSLRQRSPFSRACVLHCSTGLFLSAGRQLLVSKPLFVQPEQPGAVGCGAGTRRGFTPVKVHARPFTTSTAFCARPFAAHTLCRTGSVAAVPPAAAGVGLCAIRQGSQEGPLKQAVVPDATRLFLRRNHCTCRLLSFVGYG
eukprot:363322-Chlamydomonas_euryale.AAC.5